jgi:hypothetical protein
MTHKTLCTLVAPHCSQLNGVAHGAVACMVQLSSGLCVQISDWAVVGGT